MSNNQIKQNSISVGYLYLQDICHSLSEGIVFIFFVFSWGIYKHVFHRVKRQGFISRCII